MSRHTRHQANRRTHVTQFERLESRYCLSAVSFQFVEHPIIEGTPENTTDLKAFDLNGDGYLDALAASGFRGAVAWYQNQGDGAEFDRPQMISDKFENAISVYAGDLDGDGDLDVIAASQGGGDHPGQLAWFENTDGRGTFGRPQVISTNADDGYGWVFAADMDQDGDLDVIAAPNRSWISFPNDGWSVTWYENTDGQGSYSSERIVATGNSMFFSVSLGDLDSDGDLDVVASRGRLSGNNFTDDEIVWYENLDSRGTFSDAISISYENGGAESVFAGDVDSDGDLDIVFAPWVTETRRDSVAWYENTDGKATFGEQQSVAEGSDYAGQVSAGDLDGDDDLDIVAVTNVDGLYGNLVWYEHVDGQGIFSEKQLIAAKHSPNSIWIADVEGDADLDIMTSSYGSQAYSLFENTDGQGGFGTPRALTPRADELQSVHAADLDGDGDLDVLSASAGDDKIAWYENKNGLGDFGWQQVISMTAESVRFVHAGDLDGDGDLDVLSASLGSGPSWQNPGQIAWHENTDGEGTFGEAKIISSPNFPEVVYAADVDGDHDLDVLFLADGILAWYENLDGRGNFGFDPPKYIGRGSGSLHAADLDGDGDLDVISAFRSYDEAAVLVWFENSDGRGSFGEGRPIADGWMSFHSVHAGDVDGDGDLDLIAASYASGYNWYENTDGLGDFGEAHSIGELRSNGDYPEENAVTADMDGDGDLDVISQAQNSSGVAWYENRDGRGDFGNQQVISLAPQTFDRGLQVAAADFDADGDPDVLAAFRSEDKIVLYENLIQEAPKAGIFRDFGTIGDGDSFGVAAGDLDGDGDVDAVMVGRGATSNRVYLNNGFGQFTDSGQQLGGATGYHVELADVDGDSDLDAWISHGQAGPVTPDALWLNDGDGNFINSKQTLGTVASSGVAFGDVDRDGDLDAAVSSLDPLQPNQLWINDGIGTFSLSAESIGSDTSVALEFLDTDGDDDLDLIIVNQDEPHKLFINGGLGTFRLADTIDASSARDVAVGDLYGNGEITDIYIANAMNRNSVVEGDRIYRKSGDSYWASWFMIGETASSSVTLGDLDLDGDTDSLVTNWFEQPNSVWLNAGDGHFIEGGQLGNATSAHAAVFDMDGDGDLDVVIANEDQPNRVYENRTVAPQAGDANRDGLFDSSDLIQVFKAGEYEDETADNSTWEEGDWNGDGDFDSGDLVLALQTGSYNTGGRPLQMQIAAAVDQIFAADHDHRTDRRARAFVA